MVAKAPFAVVLASSLAILSAASPEAADSATARLRVAVKVVASCEVQIEPSGTVGVRCARGAADRILVSESQPQVMTLERDGAGTMTARAILDRPAGATGAGRVVTLQF